MFVDKETENVIADSWQFRRQNYAVSTWNLEKPYCCVDTAIIHIIT